VYVYGVDEAYFHHSGVRPLSRHGLRV
jgi:hypothetical protein